MRFPDCPINGIANAREALLGPQRRERRIDIRVQSCLHQFRLRDAVPAFVFDEYLDRGMRRKLELLLVLGSRGWSVRQNILDGMTVVSQCSSRLRLVQAIQCYG